MNVAYASGIALDIGYTAQFVETMPKPLVCKWCGLTGHKTKRSSKCIFDPSNVAKQKELIRDERKRNVEDAFDV